MSKSIEDNGLVAVSVLSGNRNFEGRISPEVRANYLMSPPLVVAYALAGHISHDFDKQPLGKDKSGQPVYLRDIWPSQAEVAATVASSIDSSMFHKEYSTISDGDRNWQNLKFPEGETYGWEPDSTYIRKAPYFDGMTATPAPVEDIIGARVLAVLGDSVTTDHISPAGSIKLNGPAGKYLTDHNVKPADFNSYGSRRGNHEVMVRGTFANVRLRNKLAPGTEGGVTRLLPDDIPMSIYDASVAYAQRSTPLAILAGKEYGSGSSRDWAAKGPRLLGIRFVIAESYERIHRSNLVGMGILPLQFLSGQNVESLLLTGEEGLPHRRKRRRAQGHARQQIRQRQDSHRHRRRRPRQDQGVLRHRPHRYPAGDSLLPARRHPAIRPPPARRQSVTKYITNNEGPRTTCVALHCLWSYVLNSARKADYEVSAGFREPR